MLSPHPTVDVADPEQTILELHITPQQMLKSLTLMNDRVLDIEIILEEDPINY